MLRPITADYWQVKTTEGGVVQLNASHVISDRSRGPQTYVESTTFLGATGKGKRPSTGRELREMWFEVPEGDNQTWLFIHANKWNLLSARWEEDGKLQIYMNTDLPVTIGKRHLEAWVEGKLYVTDSIGRDPGQYRVCDPIDLLQCLEGRITPLTLARRAKKLKVEDPRDIRIRELEKILAGCEAKISNDASFISKQNGILKRFEQITPLMMVLDDIMNARWLGFWARMVADKFYLRAKDVSPNDALERAEGVLNYFKQTS